IPDAVKAAFSNPAYFNGAIYYHGVNDVLRAFDISNGTLTQRAVTGIGTVGYPSSTPIISSNGAADGIVWETVGYYGPLVLRAYNAATLGAPLYDSTTAGDRDATGPKVKFTTPTVAGGKVFAGTDHSLAIFGLLPTVVGRRVFYNHSLFDGNDTAPSAADDGAIAT